MSFPDRTELENTGNSRNDRTHMQVDGSLQLDRRDFLKVLGGGLFVCLTHSYAGRKSPGGPSAGMSFRKMWAHGCTLRPMAR